mgnify:CR=1 FL=1
MQLDPLLSAVADAVLQSSAILTQLDSQVCSHVCICVLEIYKGARTPAAGRVGNTRASSPEHTIAPSGDGRGGIGPVSGARGDGCGAQCGSGGVGAAGLAGDNTRAAGSRGYVG